VSGCVAELINDGMDETDPKKPGSLVLVEPNNPVLEITEVVVPATLVDGTEVAKLNKPALVVEAGILNGPVFKDEPVEESGFLDSIVNSKGDPVDAFSGIEKLTFDFLDESIVSTSSVN